MAVYLLVAEIILHPLLGKSSLPSVGEVDEMTLPPCVRIVVGSHIESFSKFTGGGRQKKCPAIQKQEKTPCYVG